MVLPTRQSARGLAHSTTLRAIQWSSATRQRLGVRWPSTAIFITPNTAQTDQRSIVLPRDVTLFFFNANHNFINSR